MAIRKTSEPTPRHPYRRYRIESLADLVRFTARSDSGDTALFRGQGAGCPLLPKMARVSVDEEETTEPVRTVENRMFKEFSRTAVSYLPTLPQDLWEILAIAQHHGLPTRLLDWSQNPLIAAWFAVHEPALPRRSGVLWMYTPDEDNFVTPKERDAHPLSIKVPRVFVPRLVNPRIRSQDGVFTIHPLIAKQGFVPFERTGDHRACMTRIEIAGEHFHSIRYDLESCGVHADSVFPGLDGLARKIEVSNTYKGDDWFYD